MYAFRNQLTNVSARLRVVKSCSVKHMTSQFVFEVNN
jgi:hypothetical protein